METRLSSKNNQQGLAEASKEVKGNDRRHAAVAKLQQGMSVIQVAHLLGVPDFMGEPEWRTYYWRFDIDAADDNIIDHAAKEKDATKSSYTLLVWLTKSFHVDKVVRFSPPFWSLDIESFFGGDTNTDNTCCFGCFGSGFSNRAAIVIGSGGGVQDGTKLMDDSFRGQKETLCPQVSKPGYHYIRWWLALPSRQSGN